METINLRFKYTEEEFIGAMRLYLMRSSDFIIRLTVCLLYTIGCIFLILWLELASEVLLLFIVASFIPPLIAFTYLFVIPRQRFRSDPKFADEYFLQFSDDGILLKTEHVESMLKWSLYSKVLENEKFYLLIYGKNMLSTIPKRAFINAAQEDAFARLLRRKLPTARFDVPRLKARRSDEPQDSYVPPPSPPDWR